MRSPQGSWARSLRWGWLGSDALDQSYEPVTVVASQAYELSNQRGFRGSPRE